MRGKLESYKQDLMADYNSGMSYQDLCAKYSATRDGIRRFLIKNGCKLRQKGSWKRIYAFDTRFFQHIDTEAKAYFLGLLMADGNINNRTGTVALSLQSEDGDIIEKFRDFLGNSPPAKYISIEKLSKYSKKAQLRLTLSSRDMIEDLSNWGCTVRKSLTLKFPSDIPNHLMNHFVRGYFDGDGSINEYDGYFNRATLVSSPGFCTELQKYYVVKFGYTPRLRPTSRDKLICAYYLTWCSIGGRKFLAWLYGNASIFLKRIYLQWWKVVRYYANSTKCKWAYARTSQTYRQPHQLAFSFAE